MQNIQPSHNQLALVLVELHSMPSKNHKHILNKLIIITTITRATILETKESMREFTDLLPMIRASFHSHGEELLRHTQQMDPETDPGNGSIQQQHQQQHCLNIIIITTIRAKILETKESTRQSMDLLPAIRVSSHNHGEESRKLIQ